MIDIHSLIERNTSSLIMGSQLVLALVSHFHYDIMLPNTMENDNLNDVY